jgi:hypothetical protein
LCCNFFQLICWIVNLIFNSLLFLFVAKVFGRLGN